MENNNPKDGPRNYARSLNVRAAADLAAMAAEERGDSLLKLNEAPALASPQREDVFVAMVVKEALERYRRNSKVRAAA